MKKRIFLLMLVIAALLTTVFGLVSAQTNAPDDIEANDLWPYDVRKGLDAYMAAIREQSEAISASLEQDPLTQMEMNIKAEELSALWAHAVSDLFEEAMRITPKEDLQQLLSSHAAWTAETEKAVLEAAKAFEGGSLYPLIACSEEARLMQERAETLLELLKAAGMQ